MRLLLDTQAFVWLALDDPRLTYAARRAIVGDSGARPVVLVSAASHFELAIKVSIGKLDLARPFEAFWSEGLRRTGFSVLPIEIAHSAKLATLPFHHRDPFDRMIVAQAMIEGVGLVSSDPTLDAYGVRRVW